MSIMDAGLLIFLCVNLMITFTGRAASQAQGGGFSLQVGRLENAITLTCTDSITGNSPEPDPQFFFFRRSTGMQVDDQNGPFTRNGHVMTFSITRELEDEYTCGTPSVRSNSLALIALPTSERVEKPDPTFAVVGQPRQVQLNCAISPGNLLQQYYVTWYKVDEIIYRTSEDLNNPVTSNSERYSHNSSNLALTISNVELADASDNYHCVLRVVNPLTQSNGPGASTSYDSTLRNLNIRLVVLAHPEITHPPEPKIVVENDQDVTFSCTAFGYPTPEITWIYLDNEVRPGNSDPRPESSTQGHSIISNLIFPSVSGMDSGKIKCVASVPRGANTGGIQLNIAEAPTHMSVLGQFTDVAVRITVDSDVIFDVDLPVELEDPVRLYLKYVDVDSGKVDEVRTSAMYTNLRYIRHIEFDSDVIFERFQVTIAVESVDGIRGPLRPAGQFDKRVPNTPLRELIRQTPVIAVCSIFLFVILCALILGIFVAKNCFDIQRRKLQSNGTKVCNNINQLEKTMGQSKNEVFSMQGEDTDFVNTIVKNAAGNSPCKDTRTGSSRRFPVVRKCLRLQSVPVSSMSQKQEFDVKFNRSLSESNQQAQQLNGTASGIDPHEHRVHDDGGPEDSLSKGSYAVTTFVANKLYAGLKHPTHRKKFRKIVTELMKATKSQDDDVDSDSETAPLVTGSSSPQVQNDVVHVAINMDAMTFNADNASDDSGHANVNN